ncbi:MAG: D-alanyl-D-alanine carboxypeptidase [Chitinophagaceae bacterium]|nr:D-alanyl-D-alanine carboxypeptidase [Chitinophagaceae bacterium]
MNNYKPKGRLLHFTFYILNFTFLLSSCTIEKKLGRSASETVLEAPSLKAAHVGITIFEPATGKYWFDFQGDKYFIPASNTKIPTCYVAMKYLGDSLVGLTYYEAPGDNIYIQPGGDPTFLLAEFPNQPVLEFLRKTKKRINIDLSGWKTNPLGSGWSWNDYEATYMAERSAMPIYGNVVQFAGTVGSPLVMPGNVIESLTLDTTSKNSYFKEVSRIRAGNRFSITGGGTKPATLNVTFDTDNGRVIEKLLADTLKLPTPVLPATHKSPLPAAPGKTVFSQPTDSVLKPMMHRSDNFFAEQLLLMVSHVRLGIMSDYRIVDTILKTDFKDLPQKPRWADGSGLSRYNLFSPRDFVTILGKMKDEFGMDRIKTIFATGGEGTISSYYKSDSTYIYGKTGTLSGVVAFSGFLYTKKGKQLIFSVLVNNHQSSATEIRRAVEKFLQGIRSRY